MHPYASEPEMLLAAWERGQSLSPGRRALLLLGFACPGATREQLLQTPLGTRNHLLAGLRRSWFGEQLEAVAQCPHCSEHLEMRLPITAILERAPIDAPASAATLQWQGFTVGLRAPNSADMLALENAPLAKAAEALASSCIVSVRDQSGDAALPFVDNELMERMSEKIQELDPLADLVIDLHCSNCQQQWQSTLDLPAFLWREVAAQARRLLLEVDALARTYGWAEQDILALSTFRRQCYLEMLTA